MFNRFLAVSFVGTAVSLVVMLGAAQAGAAESPATEQAPKCRIIYINGDAMIACPKAPVVKSER